MDFQLHSLNNKDSLKVVEQKQRRGGVKTKTVERSEAGNNYEHLVEA